MNLVPKIAAILAAAFLVGCGTVGTCGCDDSCEATASCTSTTSSTTTGAAYVCPDDPSEGDARAECGIWVSVTLGDDAAPGTQEQPVRTLQRAVDLAGPGGRVYACAQTYEQPVTIPAGVSLHGGWSCSDGWEHGDDRASLSPDHDGVPLRLVKGDGDGESLITDIVVRAPDASNAGGSSIAAFADVGAAAELRRVELRAGAGADGADGTNGGAQPAPGGTAGFAGDGACTAVIGLGGEAPVTMCEDGPTSGGEGGDGSEAFAQSGGIGAPDLGAGTGGVGEEVAPACAFGSDGSDGTAGSDALGALAGGTLTASGYVAASGGSGTPGTRAQGGGGGGASYGGPGCGAAIPHGGAGGGSGGAGGCGGKPGGGGQGGGASIALASRSSGIRVTSSRLVTKAGGAGGNGGAGQVGGLGGLPGLGGAAYPGQPPIHGGCSGGFGGRGGDGGNGAGGAGGPSAPVAHLFGAAPALEDVEFVVGAAGGGGLGGNPAAGAGVGADGVAAKVLELGP